MERNYLSYRKVLKGKLMDFLEKPVSSAVKDERFIKSFSFNADSKKNYTVGVSRENGKKILLKKLFYRNKNLKYQQIKNEAVFLALASDFRDKHKSSTKIKFPRLIKLEDNNYEITLGREYIEGKNLSAFSVEKQIEILQICLDSLEEISDKIKDNSALPKRTVLFQILSLPGYLALAIIKEPKRCRVLLLLFFKYYSERLRNWNSEKSVLAHRDLHPNNILVYRKEGKEFVAVIDPEIASICEQQTDLAIIARYYFKNLGFQNIYKLLYSYLKTREQVSSFVCNSIFYTIQCIATESKSDKFYENSVIYSDTLLHQLPRIFNIIKEKNLQKVGFWSTLFNTVFFQNF